MLAVTALILQRQLSMKTVDQETGEKVVNLLFELNEEAGTTLVIVTHDMELAKKTQRILRLKGGKIFSETDNQLVSS